MKEQISKEAEEQIKDNDWNDDAVFVEDEEIGELSEEKIKDELYFDYLANKFREALDEEDITQYASPDDFLNIEEKELKDGKKRK